MFRPGDTVICNTDDPLYSRFVKKGRTYVVAGYESNLSGCGPHIFIKELNISYWIPCVAFERVNTFDVNEPAVKPRRKLLI